MKLSPWRYAHLIGAFLASIFLVIASLTGVVLAGYALLHEGNQYKWNNTHTNLHQVLPMLQNHWNEVEELTTDPRGFVRVKGLTQDLEPLHAYIAPSGEALGAVSKRNEVLQSIITLHRSLFLHQTGRYIMGGVSILLLLIGLSGLVLVFKQKGWKDFFKKGNNDDFFSLWHGLLGQWLFLPMLLIGFTGAYIAFLKPNDTQENYWVEHLPTGEMLPWDKIPSLKNIQLSDVRKITFPLSEEEPLLVKGYSGDIFISPTTGEILHQSTLSLTSKGYTLSMQLHKGTYHPLLAIILGLSCIGMLFFIYSGFAIWLSRKNTRIMNPYSATDAHYIVLFGSEGGSTAQFAGQIHKELLAQGERSYIAQLDQYQHYPEATHLLIITCTYGHGEPPSNAKTFIRKLSKIPQKAMNTSVLGFGSEKYEHFCGFAKDVQKALAVMSWANMATPLFMVNKKDTLQALAWVSAVNQAFGLKLPTDREKYEVKKEKMPKMKVVEATPVQGQDEIFCVKIKTKHAFRSGDLLAIYPTPTQERFYSIGKVDGHIHLTVKRHQMGAGSNYLYKLRAGDKFRANIVENKGFHFPASGEVILVSNGTGIAPFLGMVSENTAGLPMYLYACFSCNTPIIELYCQSLEQAKAQGKLSQYQIGYTDQGKHQRVTQLVANDAAFIAHRLATGATLMVCGSLAMYKDVAQILTDAGVDVASLQEKGQIKTDCY